MEEAITIAMLWGIMSVLRRIPPKVVIATPRLSVGIATLVSKRRYSDGFGWDLKKLKKFGEISDIWSKVSEPSVRISAKCTSDDYKLKGYILNPRINIINLRE